VTQKPGTFSDRKLAGSFERNKRPSHVDPADWERRSRSELAAELHQEGLTLREIAERLAVSHETIRRDLRKTPPPPRSNPQRWPTLVRVKAQRGAALFFDEHGNAFRDRRLLDPVGAALATTSSFEGELGDAPPGTFVRAVDVAGRARAPQLG
jgi:hypothetical protein